MWDGRFVKFSCVGGMSSWVETPEITDSFPEGWDVWGRVHLMHRITCLPQYHCDKGKACFGEKKIPLFARATY
jgi:hypothetical protein